MSSDVAALESRLKAVTARLEKVEAQLASGGSAAPSGSTSTSTSSSSSSSAGTPSAAGSKSVAAYEDLVRNYIDNYVRLSSEIDADVKKQAELVKQAVQAQISFLNIAAASKKPSDQKLGELLGPTSKIMSDIVEQRNKARGHKFFNWLSTISEGISALGWVAVSPTPGPFVDEARASSEFYSNKILVEFKNKDGGDLHRSWVAAWNTFLVELRNYIKAHHTTGLTWNPQGGEASAAAGSTSTSAGPSAGPPPPAGGPDLAALLADDAPKRPDPHSGDSRGALLAQINAVKDRQTGGRTEGLRKVQAHEKTKNQKDRSSVVSADAIKKSTTTSSAAGRQAAAKKPPKFALEGNKWSVEFQTGTQTIVIDQTETKQTVYVFKCENTVVQVKGKVNAITIDGCKKTGLVFESAISVVEVVNSQSIELQVTGSVPSIAVDKTDGCQIFLSKDCLGVELVTSKCSEMNVLLPGAKDGDDPTEIPVPEQFKTVVKNGKLVTEAVHHTG